MYGNEELNSTELCRVRLLVSGRVQNVGFRAFVQQTGNLLSLTGWVRNVDYDQVEAVAEGTRSRLEEFSVRVNTGPRGSRVDEMSIMWESYIGEYTGFIVRSSR